MDLYNILNNELNNLGREWSTIEKCLYVYLRTCEIFNYDDRWHLKSTDIDKDQLFNKKLNISQIDDYRVICSSWSNLYKDLIELLLIEDPNLDFILITGNSNHNYVKIFTYDNKILTLDPTVYGYSFLEASKGLEVSGIKYNNCSKEEWLNELELEKMLNKVTISKYPSYQDYLSLVKEELLRQQKLNNISDEVLAELFQFFVTTSNYQDLGWIEACALIFLSLKTVLEESPCLYGFKKDKYNHSISLTLKDKEITYILVRSKTNLITPNKKAK